MKNDIEQMALDLEDAHARLDRLREAVLARDQAEHLVRQLTQDLAQAKRRLKECGWRLTTLLALVRRPP